ncbi:MAG: sensor histidine kinase [Candidatus Dormibacteria bacterium]
MTTDRQPRERRDAVIAFAAAVILPGLLAGLLVTVNFNSPRDYVFLYLSIVAVLGVASGLRPALLAALVSTLLVDYLFVPPLHTLSIQNGEDVVNVVVFFGAAGLVGTLGSRRRNAQLQAQALATELQEANIQLAELNREQAEAARLAAQLADTEHQVRVLEETDRMHHEFFANMSHELRTPLGGILTGTTAIQVRADLPQGVREELDDVVAAGRRLSRLVSDMLDMARIEGGAMDLQIDDVDVGDALEAAVNRLRQVAPERAVDLRVDEGLAEVAADWDRLGQVLDNLLSNADRHAPRGTAIELSATVDGDAAAIRVVDHGDGVPAHLREHIFERFVRGDTRGGTGLGLPIVRGLITAQGGRACLEDGSGGRFTVWLPVVSTAETDAHQ